MSRLSNEQNYTCKQYEQIIINDSSEPGNYYNVGLDMDHISMINYDQICTINDDELVQYLKTFLDDISTQYGKIPYELQFTNISYTFIYPGNKYNKIFSNIEKILQQYYQGNKTINIYVDLFQTTSNAQQCQFDWLLLNYILIYYKYYTHVKITLISDQQYLIFDDILKNYQKQLVFDKYMQIFQINQRHQFDNRYQQIFHQTNKDEETIVLTSSINYQIIQPDVIYINTRLPDQNPISSDIEQQIINRQKYTAKEYITFVQEIQDGYRDVYSKIQENNYIFIFNDNITTIQQLQNNIVKQLLQIFKYTDLEQPIHQVLKSSQNLDNKQLAYYIIPVYQQNQLSFSSIYIPYNDLMMIKYLNNSGLSMNNIFHGIDVYYDKNIEDNDVVVSQQNYQSIYEYFDIKNNKVFNFMYQQGYYMNSNTYISQYELDQNVSQMIESGQGQQIEYYYINQQNQTAIHFSRSEMLQKYYINNEVQSQIYNVKNGSEQILFIQRQEQIIDDVYNIGGINGINNIYSCEELNNFIDFSIQCDNIDQLYLNINYELLLVKFNNTLISTNNLQRYTYSLKNCINQHQIFDFYNEVVCEVQNGNISLKIQEQLQPFINILMIFMLQDNINYECAQIPCYSMSLCLQQEVTQDKIIIQGEEYMPSWNRNILLQTLSPFYQNEDQINIKKQYIQLYDKIQRQEVNYHSNVSISLFFDEMQFNINKYIKNQQTNKPFLRLYSIISTEEKQCDYNELIIDNNGYIMCTLHQLGYKSLNQDYRYLKTVQFNIPFYNVELLKVLFNYSIIDITYEKRQGFYCLEGRISNEYQDQQNQIFNIQKIQNSDMYRITLLEDIIEKYYNFTNDICYQELDLLNQFVNQTFIQGKSLDLYGQTLSFEDQTQKYIDQTFNQNQIKIGYKEIKQNNILEFIIIIIIIVLLIYQLLKYSSFCD